MLFPIFNNFFSGKKVLVTGHTGFKGTWLSLWLHHLGAHVLGFSLPPPTMPNIFTAACLNNKIISVIGDIRDKKTLLEVFIRHQPEIVFHLAAQALVRRSYQEPIETYETNVMGAVNVLEACRFTPSVRAIVNVTSDKCYENFGQKNGYQENDAMGGFDPYSSSKGCSELVTRAYLHSYFNPREYARHKVALASARAGNVIGGGDWASDRLIPDCIKALKEKKEIIIRYPDAVRPWQHVLDPLYGYLVLAQRLYKEESLYSGGWNFGPDIKNEEVKPVHWLVEKIIKLWGENSSWIIDKSDCPAEAFFLALDCAKAKTRLPWQPQWNLEIALKNTVDWYKAFYNNEDMLRYTMGQIGSYEKNLLSAAT